MIEGQVYRLVLRSEESYQTASGEVRVMRSLYKDRTNDGARAVVPMEYRLGLIEGHRSPRRKPRGWLDFFHAAEHLSDAFEAAYGAGVKSRATFDKYRRILLEGPDGVEKVIRTVAYLQKCHPRRKRLKQVLGYLRKNRHRMRYADYRERDLPIGSGVVEAACKTLVTQRLKIGGMRWGDDGAQAVLTMRSWCQSDRFDRAWALLAATYKVEVHVIAPVIELHGGKFEKV